MILMGARVLTLDGTNSLLKKKPLDSEEMQCKSQTQKATGHDHQGCEHGEMNSWTCEAKYRSGLVKRIPPIY
jgi:hypothetical protein